MSNIKRKNQRLACFLSTQQSRRGGFTLIELMVVLAIAAIISAMLLAGFTSMMANQRRTTCQTNMNQVYAALRLYAADNNGFFPYYGGKDSALANADSPTVFVPPASPPTPLTDPAYNRRGIGLWALYAFPQSDVLSGDKLTLNYDYIAPKEAPTNPQNVKPLEIYLRRTNALHCPNDSDPDHNDLLATDADGVVTFREQYCSYQTVDPNLAGNIQTYKTTRVDGIPSDPADKRQLLTYADATDARPLRRNVPTDTVVTWCPWHRVNGKGRDVVLFYDGSVQSLDFDTANEGWKVKPRTP